MKTVITFLLLTITSCCYSQTRIIVNKVTFGEIHGQKSDELRNKQVQAVNYEFILSSDLEQVTIIDRLSGLSTILDFNNEQKIGNDNYLVYSIRENGGIVKFCFKLLAKRILMITYPSFDVFRLSDFEISN